MTSETDIRPEQPRHAGQIHNLAARCLGLYQCRWLERLRRSSDFLPSLSLGLWQGEQLRAHTLLARLPLRIDRQRLNALVAAPVLVHPEAAPGAGAGLLATAMREAIRQGFLLLALPLTPSYHRHAGFVPPQTASRERGPFAAGIPFVLKGLGQGNDALAQSLAPHCIVYTHAERLL